MEILLKSNCTPSEIKITSWSHIPCIQYPLRSHVHYAHVIIQLFVLKESSKPFFIKFFFLFIHDLNITVEITSFSRKVNVTKNIKPKKYFHHILFQNSQCHNNQNGQKICIFVTSWKHFCSRNLGYTLIKRFLSADSKTICKISSHVCSYVLIVERETFV